MRKPVRNEWDKAARHVLYREGRLDRGVNYFVEVLEQLGCRTYASCSGHGNSEDFYILFRVPCYAVAERIVRAGFFRVELVSTSWNKRTKLFRLGLGPAVKITRVGTTINGEGTYTATRGGLPKRERKRQWRQVLRWAADSWDRGLFHKKPRER